MRIEVFSDVICPWCFIGKRRIEKALALRPRLDAELRWRAFQLNPGMPAEGMDRTAYLAAKFGGPDGAKRIYDNVRAAGATADIAFAFERIQRTPNTVMAHRLIRRAAREVCQDAVVEALFGAYFLDGRNIGDPDALARIAAEAGMEGAAMRAYLDGTEDREEVLGEDTQARRIGIGGVPCFIFDGRYAVSGAQEPEAFLPIFDLVREAAVAEAQGEAQSPA